MGVLRAGALPGLHMQPTAQVFDGSLQFINNSKYLTRTPSAGNRRTWTWSGWFKRDALGANDNIFKVAGSSSKATQFTIMIHNGNYISIDYGGAFYLKSNRLIRNLSGWYNFVVSVDTTRTSANSRIRLYVNGVEETSFDTRNNPNEDEELGVNRNSAHTISTNDTSGFDGRFSNFYLIDGLQLGPEYFGFIDPLTNTWRPKKFRAVGTTVNDGTDWSANFSGNGGTQPSTAFDGGGPRQDGYVHSGSALTVNFSPPLSGHIIVYGGTGAGSHNPTTTDTFTLSDGSVLSSQEKYNVAPYWTVMDFGEKKNITSLVCSGGYALYAVEVDGVFLKDSTTETLNFGSNGFYLPMDNEDDFEKDKSGKGNNWTKNGFSGTSIDPDVVKDSPSGAVFGGRGQTGITTTSSAPSNYCTWNPLEPTVGTLSNGNLKMVGSSAWKSTKGTISVSSGKWYYEGIVTGTIYGQAVGNLAYGIGWLTTKNESSNVDANTSSLYNNLVGFHNNGGYNNFAAWQTSVATLVAGDVIGVSLDKDSNTFEFFRNGSSVVSGTLANTTDDLSPWTNAYYSDSFFDCNFGQKPFKFPPPQGFLPLNSASVRPETVITRPDQYVGIVKYTGNGTTGQSITGLNFDSVPDLVYIKERNNTGSPLIFDTVRGAPLALQTRANTAEYNIAETLTSFDRNGFSVDYDGSSTSIVVNRTNNYVAWCWKAGGNKNTFNVDGVGYASASAAGITNGTIPLIGCSVGTKQGFSILKYAGSGSNGTLAHGLSQAPDFFFGRDLEDTGGSRDWIIYHKSIGNTGRLKFTQDGTSTSSVFFQDTSPTNSLITIGTSNDINSTNDYILYCWHDVPGLQKFGSYGGADAFVELGFRPALLIIKSLSSSRNWIIIDSARDTFNPSDIALLVNGADVEDDNSVYAIDFLSNGFKIRGSNGQIDGDSSYIYAAWAEAPVSNLYGGQSNAR